MKKIYTTLVALMATLSMQAQGWPANYDGVMLQGFYWDSYRASVWYGFHKVPTAAADALWDMTTCTGLAITTVRLAMKPNCAR